jgi:hypothetical protein
MTYEYLLVLWEEVGRGGEGGRGEYLGLIRWATVKMAPRRTQRPPTAM